MNCFSGCVLTARASSHGFASPNQLLAPSKGGPQAGEGTAPTCQSLQLRNSITLPLSQPRAASARHRMGRIGPDASRMRGSSVLRAWPPWRQQAAEGTEALAVLTLAVLNDDSDSVQRVLDTSPGVHLRTEPTGLSALMVAVYSGHTSCVRRLLQHSPDEQVEATGRYDLNALMIAALCNRPDCMQLLLRHNPRFQVLAVSSQGWDALMIAVSCGHTACVRLLLEHIPEWQVSTVYRNGLNALMAAAGLGNAQCMQLLLAHRPAYQMARRHGNGQDALAMATRWGHAGCVRLLLAHRPSCLSLAVALGITVYCLPELQQYSSNFPEYQEARGVEKCRDLLLDELVAAISSGRWDL